MYNNVKKERRGTRGKIGVKRIRRMKLVKQNDLP